MDIKPIKKKMKLYGFNNLTKTLSFNIYDVCYALNSIEQDSYLQYIDDKYNSERLTGILTHVAEIIGANILNIASQDYDPRGASVTVLIAEEKVVDDEKHPPLVATSGVPESKTDGKTKGKAESQPLSETVLAHLDKSHITVHTYPENHPENGIATFRVDIDVSTCGKISPLKALNFLIKSFESDLIIMDYRVRGFTRETSGKKIFLDHKINSIQNFINKDLLEHYHAVDINIYQENLFHTKMILKEFDLDNYLFERSKKDFPTSEKKKIKKQLKKEMNEIFYGKNIPDMAR